MVGRVDQQVYSEFSDPCIGSGGSVTAIKISDYYTALLSRIDRLYYEVQKANLACRIVLSEQGRKLFPGISGFWKVPIYLCSSLCGLFSFFSISNCSLCESLEGKNVFVSFALTTEVVQYYHYSFVTTTHQL